MLFAGHIISASSYPISNTISLEDGRSPLRHRWAAVLILRPTPRALLGDNKQAMLERSGWCPALTHLYQSLGAIYLLDSPMGTCHRPPSGICLEPGSFGIGACRYCAPVPPTRQASRTPALFSASLIFPQVSQSFKALLLSV